MASELLQTKLAVPPLRAALVARRALFARLDEGMLRRLTLVSAPAGYGKTTLVASWLAQKREAVGWISLDKGDNDPARFLLYLLAALRDACPTLQGPAPTLFHAPHPPPPEQVLTTLINEFERQFDGPAGSNRCVLVLDDYHVIANEALHAAIAFLLVHLPQALSVIIITRADPPLPLARLRAQGQLLELRQADLRFTLEETGDFLHDVMRLALDAEETTLLANRTEGWIAGLQLAALSLRRCEDSAQFVRMFGGSHRFVLDYLLEEVLQGKEPEIQAFMLQSSIVEQLCSSLCDALLQETAAQVAAVLPDAGEKATAAQDLLEYLERHNLFLFALDEERKWYRYHRLFLDLLRRRLWQTLPERIPDLHRRASAWYEGQGDVDNAIAHALAAGEEGRAIDLVARRAETVLMRGELTTLVAWVEALSEEAVLGHPYLSLLYAWALLASGRPAHMVEAHLAAAEQDDATRGQAAAVRAVLAAVRGEFRVAHALASRALHVLGAEHHFLRDLATLVRGISARATGDLAAATQALEEATAVSRAGGDVMLTVLAICGRAALAVQEGDLSGARLLYEQALLAAQDGQGRYRPIAGEALIGLGRIALQRHELEAAASYLEEGISLCRHWSGPAALEGIVVKAALAVAEGEVRQAESILQEAADLARLWDATELDDTAVALARAQVALQRDDLAMARRWVEGRDLPLEANAIAAAVAENAARANEYLTLARLWLKEDRVEALLMLLDHLWPFLESCESRIRALLLRAAGLETRGDEAGALEAVAEALILGEAGGFRRAFLEAMDKRTMRRLLGQIRRQGQRVAYVDALLEAMPRQTATVGRPAPAQQGLPEPLSEREQEVLVLVAKGLSNQAVADRLCLSLATVKWHNSNIYGKLGVSNRLEAVNRAQALGILEPFQEHADLV